MMAFKKLLLHASLNLFGELERVARSFTPFFFFFSLENIFGFV